MPKTIEELQAELDDLKSGNDALALKNSEILDELKKERKSNKANDVDMDKFYDLKDELEKSQNQVKGLESTIKANGKDLEKATNSLTEKDTTLQNLLIDGGLSDNMSKLGVKAEFTDAVKALLRGQVSLVDNKAMVGDKPLSEFMTEWSGDAGKVYIGANNNSGGDANGGDKKGGDSKMKRSDMSHSEKGQFIKEHGDAEYFKLQA